MMLVLQAQDHGSPSPGPVAGLRVLMLGGRGQEINRNKIKRWALLCVFICVYICVHVCALVWRAEGQPWVPLLDSLSLGLSHGSELITWALLAG